LRRRAAKSTLPACLTSLIYRTEVLAMLGALADLVVDVRAIREAFEDEEEEEGE
jgi:hypothetical protein